MTRASQIVDTQFYTYLHSIFGNLRPFRNRLISASPFISHSEHTDSLLLFAITDTSSSSATQHSFLVRILSSQSCMSSIAALFQSLSTRMLIVSQKPECAMWGISGVSRLIFFNGLMGAPRNRVWLITSEYAQRRRPIRHLVLSGSCRGVLLEVTQHCDGRHQNRRSKWFLWPIASENGTMRQCCDFHFIGYYRE